MNALINFEVYEDAVTMLGMAKVTYPDLAWLTQTVSGAGIAGNVETVIQGHVDAMTLGLNFNTITDQIIQLSEPRLHNIDLRVAQQVDDKVSGTIRVQSIKEIFVVMPKTFKGGSIAPASISDGSGEYAVRYWASYVDGVRKREIDPLNYICFINGVDYLADVRRALGK